MPLLWPAHREALREVRRWVLDRPGDAPDALARRLVRERPDLALAALTLAVVRVRKRAERAVKQ